MMYQLTMQDVTYQDYPIQYFSNPSTGIEEIDIRDFWSSVLFNWIRKQQKRPIYRSLGSLIDLDMSSILPRFEIKSETSMFEEILEMVIPEEILEFDVVVRMPPIKVQSLRVRVKSVEKATPSIVEPEGF